MPDTTRPHQPTRGADRNRTVADDADTPDNMVLPTLEPGITLLDIDGDDRGVPVVQSLACDHLLMNDGPAFWVDTAGYATTTGLGRLAPSQRLVDRIHVARGFTAYQHYSILAELTTAIEGRCHADGETPSLIVAPAIDGQYRDTDTLAADDANTLLARGLAVLATAAEQYDIPVLCTRTTQDEIGTSVARAADHALECRHTDLGPRFVDEDFETRLYPAAGGGYQTTLVYWRDVLRARASHVGVETPSHPSAGSQTGTDDTPTVDPLADLGSTRGGH